MTSTEKLAFRIAELPELLGLSRSKIYLEISAGRLIARRSGGRTLVLRKDLEDYVNSLPRTGSASEGQHRKMKVVPYGLSSVLKNMRVVRRYEMSAKLCQHVLASLEAARIFDDCLPDPVPSQLMQANGIDLDTACNLAGPIVCRNGSFCTARFELDPLGEACLIMSVLDEDAETTIDVVGWSAQEPERFASMFGTCGVLGIDQLLNPATYYGWLTVPGLANPVELVESRMSGCRHPRPVTRLIVNFAWPKDCLPPSRSSMAVTWSCQDSFLKAAWLFLLPLRRAA
jgi:excisionase family DNA binding protein